MNVTALLDTNATALERYLYSPSGAPTIFDGTWSTIRTSSLYDNGLLFAGYRFDAATGLYLARNRDLHAQLGLWTSRDPIGYDAGGNLYGYASQNPGNGLDPYGLIDAPGFGESLIPIWGSGKQALHDFGCGDWGWGIFNTALAVSDVFLVKSLVTGAGKVVARTAWKSIGSHTWGATSSWIGERGVREFAGQQFHHWLVPQRWFADTAGGLGATLFNQPWNLVPLPRSSRFAQWQIHRAVEGLSGSGIPFLQRTWYRAAYSTPTWFKSGTAYVAGREATQLLDSKGCGCG